MRRPTLQSTKTFCSNPSIYHLPSDLDFMYIYPFTEAFLENGQTPLAFTKKKTIHRSFNREQRDGYYLKRYKARLEPMKYACFILDAMDQNKLLIPNLCLSSKEYADATKLRTHLTCVLDHGGQSALCIVDLFQWPHG